MLAGDYGRERAMIAAHQIAFGKGAGAKKPYDAEIEYLESTGTQWIDTGLDFDSGDWACDAFLTVTKSMNELYIISTKLAGVGGVYSFAYTNLSEIRLAYSHNNAAYRSVSNDFFGQGFVWKSRFTNGSQTLEVGKYALSANQQFKALTNPEAYSIIIGGMINYGSKGNGVRFGKIKISHNSVLVRDYIPVRVGNIGYMYDRVSGQLFGNQGTGEFVLGKDVGDDVEYTAKDYIQDGLVALVDGIENAGWGEHTDELKYVNLVTGEQFSFENSNNVLWGSDCLKILESGNLASGLLTGISFSASKLGISTNAKNYTIECAIRAYDAEYPLISFDGGFGRTLGTASTDNFQGVVTSAYLSDTNTLQWGVNGDIRSKTDSGVQQVKFNGFYWNNREVYSSGRFRFGFTYSYVCKSDLHCARVYSRALTAEEIAYNYNIDKARFNI
jgi:hypothetical protein